MPARAISVAVIVMFLGAVACAAVAAAQSIGNAGTIEGTVVDPSGATVPNASVTVANDLTRYKESTVTGADGTFRLANIPPNPYHIDVVASGFTPLHQDVNVRSSVPLKLKLALVIAGGETTIVVEAHGSLLENVPYAHNDVDQAEYAKLPAASPGSGLSDLITLASPGVVADSNGFFHPLGDHAQTTFSVDGQPISDQQSKQFSTQLPPNAIQSMELVTGAPNAEFGDKTSLVVNAVTRSGLGQKPFGSTSVEYGSFGTVAEETAFGMGTAKAGNFIAANALRSGRFLDTPEFRPYHAIGNNYTLFDHFDYQPGGNNGFHVNLFHARNWFQVPDTFDQLWSGQDQRQKAVTFNVAPTYQHTFSPRALFSMTAFWRHDDVNYYPSRDPLADTPATVGQGRTLTNWGTRTELSYVRGKHSFKAGTQIMQTRLREGFQFGVTDPNFNPVCVGPDGSPVAAPGITDPAACAAQGFSANPALQPGLIPFDLTRGGSLFQFAGKANINQFAGYVQDAMTLGNLTANVGLRVDRYNGLTQATGVQPRLGLSYLIKPTGTVLRAAYSRTFETPYNENLILSSATGAGGLAANVFGAFATEPIKPGRRNQFNAGFEQKAGRWLVVDADYFWKYTDNAFDFGALFNTPITFPISWRKSKIDGVAVRLSTPELHGFQIYTTMGHTRARYFGPSNGGLIFNSPLDNSVFRIDHDQAFQQTTNVRYQRPNHGPWAAFTWRYDSGEVAGAVTGLQDALALTAAQQAAIGFFCGSQQATLSTPITSCSSPVFGATRLVIPAPGAADADHNPPRVAPRHLFDIAAGTDRLFHTEHTRTTLKLMVTNLTNNVALYNFLSTFSGTHFVAPRTYTAQIGVVF